MTISTAIDEIQLVFSYFTPIVFFCILNLMIGIIYTLHSQRKQSKPTQQEEYQFNPHPQPSLFQRVISFKLSNTNSDSDPKPDPIHTEQNFNSDSKPDPIHTEQVVQVARSNSETVVKKLLPPKAKLKVLRKSASEKLLPKGEMKETEEEVERRRPETVREKTKGSGGDDEEVDGKCDDFINKFRQQLKLQRLNSFLRYKEMLNRGAER